MTDQEKEMRIGILATPISVWEILKQPKTTMNVS